MWEVDLGRLPVRWGEHGDAWNGWLSMLIGINGGTIHGGPGVGLTEEIQYEPADDDMLSILVAVPDDGWIHCYVQGQNDAAHPDDELQVAPWREAVHEAADHALAGPRQPGTP